MGSMYSMFTGKDAVLTFVIYAAIDKEYLSGEITLPLKPMATAKLIVALEEVLDNASDSILNIRDDEGNVCKDFVKLMEELFDFFADYLLALDNIEKNREVLGELGETYLPRKRAYFEQLGDYLKLYGDAGQIRVLTHIPSHVLFLTNTLTWWALNANLSFPGEPVPRDAAKEICIGIIKRAYQL